MPGDVAFMHKYLCKPNSDPRRGTTRSEIIFSYEYKCLFLLSLSPSFLPLSFFVSLIFFLSLFGSWSLHFAFAAPRVPGNRSILLLTYLYVSALAANAFSRANGSLDCVSFKEKSPVLVILHGIKGEDLNCAYTPNILIECGFYSYARKKYQFVQLNKSQRKVR